MRLFVLLIVAIAVAGCSHRDGHDGMDGLGVALAVKKVLNSDERR
jgi:hypothetical protein